MPWASGDVGGLKRCLRVAFVRTHPDKVPGQAELFQRLVTLKEDVEEVLQSELRRLGAGLPEQPDWGPEFGGTAQPSAPSASAAPHAASPAPPTPPTADFWADDDTAGFTSAAAGAYSGAPKQPAERKAPPPNAGPA